LVKVLVSTEGAVFNALVWGEPLNLRLRNLASANPKHFVWREKYFDVLNRLGVTHTCDRRTARQTLP